VTIHCHPELERSPIQTAARLLADSRRLLVLGGAGMSADAGVPTFRDEGGYWRTVRSEDLASRDGFERAPGMVWDWYRERRLTVANAHPHAGQRALSLLQRHAQARILVATTNEDDLLERAGVEGVVHLHGDLFTTRCAADCGWAAKDDQDNSLSLAPCPACGAPVRPGSIWFGEPLPREALDQVAAFEPDGLLLVGSSCLVKPVSDLPLDLVNHGCPVVEINPESTPISDYVAVSLRGTAKQTIPALVDLLTSCTVRDQARRIT
jgi:NAD-dependent deacetylase